MRILKREVKVHFYLSSLLTFHKILGQHFEKGSFGHQFSASQSSIQIPSNHNQRKLKQQSNGDGERVVLLMALFSHDLEVFSAAQLIVTSVHVSSEGL